jgi:hypothetical protein
VYILHEIPDETDLPPKASPSAHLPAQTMNSTDPSSIERRRREAREELKAREERKTRSRPRPSSPGHIPLGPATRDGGEPTEPPVGKGLTTAVLTATAISVAVIALLFALSPTP